MNIILIYGVPFALHFRENQMVITDGNAGTIHGLKILFIGKGPAKRPNHNHDLPTILLA
jgi:hypothetical protein